MKNIINYDLKKFKTEHFKGFPKKLIRPLHFTNRNEYYDFKKVIFICIYTFCEDQHYYILQGKQKKTYIAYKS